MLKKARQRLERSNNVETECKPDLSFWKNSIKVKELEHNTKDARKNILSSYWSLRVGIIFQQNAGQLYKVSHLKF